MTETNDKTRSLEDVQAERQKLAEAQQRIAEELAKLDADEPDLIASETHLEAEQLRQGRPAKASKKLKDLRERRADLEGQLPTLEHLGRALTVEELRLQLRDAEERSAALSEDRRKVDERLAKVQDERQEKANASHATYAEIADLHQRLEFNEWQLAEIDPDVAREREERRIREAGNLVLTDEQREIWWREKLARSGGHVVEDEADLRRLREEVGPSSEIVSPPNIRQNQERRSTDGDPSTGIGPRRKDREE